MKSIKKTIFSFITCAALLSTFAMAACGGPATNDNNGDGGNGGNNPPITTPVGDVASVKADASKAKTSYYVGDTLDLSGVVLNVTMTDGTTTTVTLPNDDVTVGNVDMSKAGKKAVNITYGGKSTYFTITIEEHVWKVTFNYNDNTTEDKVVEVENGDKVREEELEDKKVGEDTWQFNGWFTDDETFMNAYDFDTPITTDLNLYAQWLVGKYYYITFDYNYYGGYAAHTFEYPVKAEDEAGNDLPAAQIKVPEPEEPERYGYEFTGWYTDAEATTEFSFDTPVTDGLKLYAGWECTVTGTNEYIFEAEDTDLSRKSGYGYSSAPAGEAMIVTDTTGSVGASGADKQYVNYLYKNGLSLDFYIASDRDVKDAKIVLRLGAAFAAQTITPDLYSITVNGTVLSYDDISLPYYDIEPGVDPTKYGEGAYKMNDYEIALNVSLKKGANQIILTTTNNDDSLGGTMKALAPCVDCIKITTSAVLIWDATKGLPWIP